MHEASSDPHICVFLTWCRYFSHDDTFLRRDQKAELLCPVGTSLINDPLCWEKIVLSFSCL